MAGRLAGKVAIVTGGARGIGEASVRSFVAEGARVVVADLLKEEGEMLAKELGDAVAFHPLDVTRQSEWEATVAFCVEHFGPPDILVNNAGVMVVGTIESSTEDDYRRAFEVNVLGAFLGTRSVIEPMKANGGGSIIVMSSLAGMLMGTYGLGAYSASKSGNAAFARVAALELGEYGIRVNSIHPGGIDTVMSRGPGFEEMDRDEHYRGLPIPRIGQPVDIAQTVLFLASDESSYVTGTEAVVDGGMRAGKGKLF